MGGTLRRYDPGDSVTLLRSVEDSAGTPTDATVALTVTLPDGSTATPVVSHPDTGEYAASVPVTAYGVYRYMWSVTGAVVDVSTGSFYVADDVDVLPPLASLDRLIRKLGYTPTPESELDRAAANLDAASDLIRDVAGKTWADPDTGALESVPRRVVSICVEATYRAFSNPEALSQRSIGDSSKSWDRAGREGGEGVFLTSAEEESVRKASETSSFASIQVVSPYSGVDLDTEDLVWA